MTLADLRKLSIKKQLRIRFSLSNGMECVITTEGIARVPALKGIPDFNLEQELASAAEFRIEPANHPDRKNAPGARQLSREELAAMAAGPAARHHAPDDHEDE